MILRKQFTLLLAALAVVFVLVLPVRPALSQEYDGYAEFARTPSASWYITIDARGNASSSLTLSGIKDVPLADIQSGIVPALEQALQCKLVHVKAYPSKFILSHRSDCRIPLTRDGLVARGEIKPDAVQERLRRAGLMQLIITLSVPRLGYNAAPAGSKEFAYGQHLTYSLNQKTDQQPTDIVFAFGYSTGFLLAMTILLPLVLAVPLVLIFMTQAKTLTLAARDATAAWFGYWRVQRWVTEGVWIVWLILLSTLRVEAFLEFVSGHKDPLLHAVLYFGPPGVVSFLCSYLSRPLWLKVRGVAWNRKDMLARAFWQHVASILPMAFIIVGIGSLAQQGSGLAWFAGALAAKLLGAWQYARVTKSLPHALHGGELKEKILEMAERAGVRIRQVFLMPAKELHMGNAFAMQGQRVMITDYLLERLTRRETDCVMAHEIGHVKKRHTLLLSWAGFLVVFLIVNIVMRTLFTIVPALLVNAGMRGADDPFKTVQWLSDYLLYPVSLLSTLLIRYFLSRQLERSADEFGALVTNDPESMITSLVKLSKMNLMPLGWGKWDEGLSTHPSTLRRAEAIATNHRIPRERLAELLRTEPRREEREGYSVPHEALDSSLVFSSEKKTRTGMVIALVMLASISLPPLALGSMIVFFKLSSSLYASGLVLVPLLYLLTASYLSLIRYGSYQRNLREKLAKKGLALGADFQFVGYSPEAFPRSYDNNVVWDVAFLAIREEGIVCYGDKTSFLIPRHTIRSIRRGQSFPSWFDVPETNITWSDNGRDHILHLHSVDGSSMFAIGEKSKKLLQELVAWHEGRKPASSAIGDGTLGMPAFPVLTGVQPRESGSLRNFASSVFLAGLFVFGVSALFRLESVVPWYGFGMALWCLILANLPVWRYRDDISSRTAARPADNVRSIVRGSVAAVPAGVDGDKAKTINKRLAIGLGIAGLGSIAVLYILFIGLMVYKPGVLVGLMPVPSRVVAVQSDNNALHLFSSKPDFDNFDPHQKMPPRMRYFESTLSETDQSAPREIAPFTGASSAGASMALFSAGAYRMSDGSQWTEIRTEGIGENPKGIVTPQGLFVFSRLKEGVRLNRINGATSTEIPLPPEFLGADKDVHCRSAELAWYQDQLAFFWSDRERISWTLWNGTSWSPAAVSGPFSGVYHIIADEKALHFLNQEHYGPDSTVSHYVFENNEWGTPAILSLPEGFGMWQVFLHKGTPMLLNEQAFAQTLYTIDGRGLTKKADLAPAQGPLRFARPFASIVIGANLLLFFFIFAASLLVGKYKVRTAGTPGHDYQFASLLRRFLANLADTVIILLVPALLVALSLPRAASRQNPLQVMSFVVLAVLFYFVAGLLYHALSEGLFGKTLGKKICGIKVLKADLTPCTFSAGFLRNLMRIVDSFFYYLVGAVSLAATVKWQRLGDLVAETVVVKEK